MKKKNYCANAYKLRTLALWNFDFD